MAASLRLTLGIENERATGSLWGGGNQGMQMLEQTLCFFKTYIEKAKNYNITSS